MDEKENIKLLSVTRRMNDLTGKVFDRLTVIGYTGKNKAGNSMWLCRCECGKEKIVRGTHLTHGESKSCGCISGEMLGPYRTKHGMRDSRIYSIWRGMKGRCNNVNSNSYKNYGGRGITYDPKWSTFEGFYEDMKEGYQDELTLDRKDVNGNYCKSNCKWSTWREQHSNRRNNAKVKLNGAEVPLMELYYNEGRVVPYQTVYYRVYHMGWDIERALTQPIKESDV